jgi:ribosomal subunit interface protein
MKLPLQVSFRNMGPSDAIRAAVVARAERLDRYFGRSMACRVVVEAPHKHKRKGNLYRVRVGLTVPGREIVAGREHAEDQAHEDVYVAIRDAFDEARRKLQDHVRRHRGWRKPRVGPPHGRMVRLFRAEGYGFVEAVDGREVYRAERGRVARGRPRAEGLKGSGPGRDRGPSRPVPGAGGLP